MPTENPIEHVAREVAERQVKPVEVQEGPSKILNFFQRAAAARTKNVAPQIVLNNAENN